MKDKLDLDKTTGKNATYVCDSQSTQSCPSLRQILILGDTFRTESLNCPVYDFKSHRWNNKLHSIRYVKSNRHLHTLAMPISFRAPFARALSIYRMHQKVSTVLEFWFAYLRRSRKYEQACAFDLGARLSDVSDNSAWHDVMTGLLGSQENAAHHVHTGTSRRSSLKDPLLVESWYLTPAEPPRSNACNGGCAPG